MECDIENATENIRGIVWEAYVELQKMQPIAKEIQQYACLKEAKGEFYGVVQIYTPP